jgi:hypothetical protein
MLRFYARLFFGDIMHLIRSFFAVMSSCGTS